MVWRQETKAGSHRLGPGPLPALNEKPKEALKGRARISSQDPESREEGTGPPGWSGVKGFGRLCRASHSADGLSKFSGGAGWLGWMAIPYPGEDGSPVTHEPPKTESSRRKAMIRRRRNEEIPARQTRATVEVRHETSESGRFYPPAAVIATPWRWTPARWGLSADFYAGRCPGGALPSQPWGPRFIAFLLTACKTIRVHLPHVE